MSLITVIGRGHSGTRAISHTLSTSGVFMGEPLNPSGDLVPPEAMYDACRVAARAVHWNGGVSWDWSQLIDGEPTAEFVGLIERYLASVLDSSATHKGWKIPETTLCFPWITRMFPDAKFIFWVRNPRDCILGHHVTDDLADFGIRYPATDDARRRRAISWSYQYDLVRATPRPRNWIEVRFEDFVLRQAETLTRLEQFLGIPLARIPVRPEAVGRWMQDELDPTTGPNYFPFLEPPMREYGYETPAAA